MADRPVGESVSTEPALRPDGRILPGSVVTLVKLTSQHATDLYPLIHGDENAHVWTYLFEGPFHTQDSFQAMIDAKAQSEDPFFYAILDNATQKPVGYASLMRIEPQHRVIEVGNVMYTPVLQRSKAATETMYLLAKHAFDDLGYRRYEWKCNNLNAPSKRAAERLGFTFEGVFRQHIITKGRNRDTAWFSMLDKEWPAVKQGFEIWLADSNFDEDQKQKATLQQCRQEG